MDSFPAFKTQWSVRSNELMCCQKMGPGGYYDFLGVGFVRLDWTVVWVPIMRVSDQLMATREV